MDDSILAQLADERDVAQDETDAAWELYQLAKAHGTPRTVRAAHQVYAAALGRYHRALVLINSHTHPGTVVVRPYRADGTLDQIADALIGQE